MESAAQASPAQPTAPPPAQTVSYNGGAREEFQSGDVLCFRGKGLISWCIRQLTRSPYSHAGITYVFEGRVYCLEAVGSGVRLALMSELTKRYRGGIDYYDVPKATGDQRRIAISFAFPQLGKLYDKRGILRFLRAIITGRTPKVKPDSQWFCSELVAAAFADARLPLVSLSDASYVSPGDLANSAQLLFRYRVKR